MLRSFTAAAVRSPLAAVAWRHLHVGSRCNSGEQAESVVYRMSMLRPPPVVRNWEVARNSCSLIGRLAAPVRPTSTSSEECPRAYTFLSVPSSSPSSSSSNFSVTLQLKGDLASVCLQHLKQNDLVYVSGRLSSYHKGNVSGEQEIVYKICVLELNYVLDRNNKMRNAGDATDVAPTPLANTEIHSEKCTDQLRLWQIFFASPYEWWDNRQSKPYTNYPDFKHKDTREKLWLHPDDPPWVRKLLELHDLEIAKNGRKDGGWLSEKHTWKAQDFY